MNEVGKEEDSGIVRVKVNPRYYRPTEVIIIRQKYIHFVGRCFFKFNLVREVEFKNIVE